MLVKVVKIPFRACGSLSTFELSSGGTFVFRCGRCGASNLIYVDKKLGVRDVRKVEEIKPTGRLRIARPDLWPASLLPLKPMVEALVEGRDVEVTDSLLEAVQVLVNLGVLEVV